MRGIGSEKLVKFRGTVDIVARCAKTKKEARWRFQALYCPSCPENLISLSALGDNKSKELKLRTSREGWCGEFVINSPDGKSHRWCAAEHPQLKGIVCVNILGPTRVVRAGKPEKPVVAEAPRSRLPRSIRVHASIATALSNSDAAGVTRGVQELEENAILSAGAGGVSTFDEIAYRRARENLHQHVALGHYVNGKALQRAVNEGMISLPGVKSDFFTEPHDKRCQQCAITNTRGTGITRRRVNTSTIMPFAHFKCDFKFVTKVELSDGNENIKDVLGHRRQSAFLPQEGSMPKTVLLVVDSSTRMAFSASCASRNQRDVKAAMASILAQIRGVVANMRVLTGDPMCCSVHKFSGDDDPSLWAGCREAILEAGSYFANVQAFSDGLPPLPTINENNMAQAASNGINEANERAISRIWRSIALQSSHIYSSQFMSIEAFHHATRLANILPKTDENGDMYTPYNRLTGGTARGDLFFPFGAIGYYIDQNASKTSPTRRRPCLYLSTLIEVPHDREKRHVSQFLVLDWFHAQNNQPQHWKKRTIYASFIAHDIAPSDIESVFHKYEAELTANLAPMEAFLRDAEDDVHAAPTPQQPIRQRPPPLQNGIGGARSSCVLVEIDESDATRGGADIDARKEKNNAVEAVATGVVGENEKNTTV